MGENDDSAFDAAHSVFGHRILGLKMGHLCIVEMAATTETPVTLELLAKELKALRKDVRKIRQHFEDPTGEKQAARSQNNGFNKPLNVTDKLRAFLSLAADEKISRSQVTGRINTYVTEKGLKAGQNITLDATLQDLLQPPEGTQITFLNIQKYINPHYIKDPTTEKKPREKKVKPEPVGAGDASPDVAPKEKKVRPKVAKAPAS
jgi:upstream activation factor subunit UAF30